MKRLRFRIYLEGTELFLEKKTSQAEIDEVLKWLYIQSEGWCARKERP